MKKKLILSVLLSLVFLQSFSQKQINIGKSCSYYGEKMPTQAYTFSSDNEAEAALKLITDASGLSPNFTIVAGNVPNACATMIYNSQTKELERYIVYNQTFMYNISQKLNYWASISILAHEVGHHLNGHSLQLGGSRPSLELEADKFSGFILAKLGATLEDAQSAINSLVSEQGSTTHPPKSARLASIANGWYQNSSNSRNSNVGITKSNTNQRPTDIGTNNSNIYYKKLKSDIYDANDIEVYSDNYKFEKNEYKFFTINANWKDGGTCRNPKILVLYFVGYEKYFYTHDYDLDPQNISLKLKTIFYSPNPYMYLGGKCYTSAYYKGEKLINEDRIPTDRKYNPSGFTHSTWTETESKQTYSNGLDLYRQPYGPGFKGLMIPEPAFTYPPR